MGLFYQNDIESVQASEKRIQCFKIGSVLEAVNTIKILLERKENKEVLALYGGGRYVLCQEYKIGMLQYGILGPQKGGSDTLTISGLQQQHSSKRL